MNFLLMFVVMAGIQFALWSVMFPVNDDDDADVGDNYEIFP